MHEDLYGILDPRIASGVAKLPAKTIDLMDSYSNEEDDVVIIEGVPPNAKEEEEMIQPLDTLLSPSNQKREMSI